VWPRSEPQAKVQVNHTIRPARPRIGYGPQLWRVKWRSAAGTVSKLEASRGDLLHHSSLEVDLLFSLDLARCVEYTQNRRTRVEVDQDRLNL